jgi:hypothetical protein
LKGLDVLFDVSDQILKYGWYWSGAYSCQPYSGSLGFSGFGLPFEVWGFVVPMITLSEPLLAAVVDYVLKLKVSLVHNSFR